MTTRSRVLLYASYALVLVGVLPPMLDRYLNPYVQHLNSLPDVISFPLAIWGFLDYALGKELCLVLAACVLLVMVSRDIKWAAKIPLAALTPVAVSVVLHWVHRLAAES